MKASSLGARIRDRADRAGVRIELSQIEQLETYWRLLAHWNGRMNLTGLPLRDFPDRSVDRLLIEPLLVTEQLHAAALNWFDFGSGAGSPAIPLKIVRQQARLTLVESKARKAAFLREVVRRLQLAEATVFCGRVERLSDSQPPSTADLVTVRAIKLDLPMLKATFNLLSSSGKLLAFASAAASERLASFAAAGLDLIVEVPLLTPGAVLQVLKKRSQK